MALKSVGKFVKPSQTCEHKEATHAEASEEDSNDYEMALIIKMFQYLARKNKRFFGRRSDFRGTSSRVNKDDQNECFNCHKLDHFMVDYPEIHKHKAKKVSVKKNNFRSKFKESPLALWD